MSSWEDIANEVAPSNVPTRGLATGANRQAVGARIAPPNQKHVVSAPECGPDTPLQVVLQGDDRETENGAFFHVARDAKEFDENYFDLNKLLGDAVEIVSKKTRAKTRAEDLLFLDIETTGLSSSVPLFLIGSLHAGAESSGSKLELFLARTKREERAAIASFLEMVEGKTLVSFNGKSFDWPFIEGRALRLGLQIPKPRAHFDLLHLARSQWKSQVPNCRLQTLEYYLCGRSREGDVASSKIPDQYWKFAKMYETTGRGAHLMTPIVHHNTWDVLTMADLLKCAVQSTK